MPTGVIVVIKLFSLDQPAWTVKTVASEQFYDQVKAHWSTQEPFDANNIKKEIEDVLGEFNNSLHTRVFLQPIDDVGMEDTLDLIGAKLGAGNSGLETMSAISAIMEGMEDVYAHTPAAMVDTVPEGRGGY